MSSLLSLFLLGILVGIASGKAFSASDEDRDALRLFLQNAVPDHARDAFNFSDSPCRWPGVSCSASGDRVQIIDIQAFGLRGSIPQGSIGKLKGLVRLNLFNNKVSGSIPSDIWSLPSLQYLNLSSNQLSGSMGIDSTSTSTSSLVVLDLSRNSISGQIPDRIGSLSKLSRLNLSSNDLQDRIPAAIFNCTLLEQLDLSSNKLSGDIPQGLGHLGLLQVLLLNENQLQGFVAPVDLSRLHYLRVLDLSGNQLGGAFPRLDGLRKLELLNVSRNQLSGALPSAAFRLPELRYLAARDNRLSGVLPSPSTTKSSSLVFIDLGRNQLSGLVPDAIWNLPSLEVLRLDKNSLTGPLPQQLGASLKEVDLSTNVFQGEVPADLGGYQGLVYLDVSSNRLNGEIPDKLMTGFPFLVHLGLSNNTFAQSRFPDVHQGMGRLQYLNLSATHLVGSIPKQLGDMHRLKQLDLSHNGLHGSIPDSIGQLKSLLLLDLSYNHLNGSIPASLEGLTQLQRANFSYNELRGQVYAWPFMVASEVIGNKGLCGTLLNTTCPTTQHEKPAATHEKAATQASHRKHMKIAFIIGIAAGAVAALLLVCVVLAWFILGAWKRCRCYCCCQSKKAPPKEERYISMSGPFSSEMEPAVWAAGVRDPQTVPVVMFEKPLLNVTFSDLLQATSNFSKEYQVPDSGWGPVFRGSLGGTTAAIKILGEGIACADVAEAAAQLASIGRLKHPNIAPLLGYCMVGVERLLIYEYVQDNGDLFGRLHELPEGVRNLEDWSTDTWESGLESQSHLSGGRLGWGSRHRIALGTARALAFLHHGCCPPVVHRDVKAGNVLLDAEFEARLAGTGVADLVEVGPEPGYIPPEQQASSSSVGNKEASPKGDVYAFGVILLELVTGKRPLGDDYNGDGSYSTGTSLVSWTRSLIKEKRGFKALDVRVMRGDETETNEMLETLRIGYLCTAESPAKRPTMQQVVGLLKDLRPVSGGLGSQ